MAKDKDRTLNPAAAQRKAEKQKALKKGKAAVAAQRTERYASRNPARLERTIEDLKAEKEVKGGKLGSRDQKLLEDAERDLARVKKAREALGDKAPAFGRDGGGGGNERGGRGRGHGDRRGGYTGLGKRAREGDEGDSSGSETDESVRKIPWPRDTPPPIPHHPRQRNATSRSTNNANEEPLGASRIPHRKGEEREGEVVPDTSLPPKPVVQTKTTYESAPVVRDLRKEATQRFVPGVVRRKIEAKAGKGGRLLEEEDVQGLEREGYGGAAGGKAGDGVGKVGGDGSGSGRAGVVIDAAPAVRDGETDDAESEREKRRLEEEEERFTREMEMEAGIGGGDEGGGEREEGPKAIGVEMEEVSDEDL